MKKNPHQHELRSGQLYRGVTFGTIIGLVLQVDTLASDLPGVVMSTEFALKYRGTLCGGADLNGDGMNDIVGSSHVGGVDLVASFDGKTGSAMFGVASTGPEDIWGTVVRLAGDVDNDGVVDIVAVSKSHFYVRILSGANGAILRTIQGPPSGYFGQSADGIGDYDGDGAADIVVSDRGGSPSGYVQVFQALSGALIATYFPIQPYISGSTLVVAGVGDTNGDGFDDFAYSVSQFTGAFPPVSFRRVHVALGPTGAEPFPPLVSGQTDDGFSGNEGSLRRGGDLDGDGRPDLLVGAWTYDNGPTSPPGRIFAFSGASGAALLSIPTPIVNTSAFGYGSAIAAIGDLDGDGRSDIAVGDQAGKDPGVSGTNVGVVRVHSGATGNVLRTVHGLPSSSLGGSVSEAGDMNGNGRPDVLTSWHPSTPGVTPGSIAISLDCGNVTYFGNGCPGVGGTTPTINVLSDCFSPGVPLTISILGAPFGPSFALLAIGSAIGASPINPNCSFLVGGSSPVIFPIAMNFAGLGTFSADLPLGFTQSFAVQAFIPAPGTSLGFSATRGAFVDVD